MSGYSGRVRTATVLTWICLAAAASPTVCNAQEADIPDENLRAAIEDALGKRSGQAVTVADMESLKAFQARSDGIKDLTGLELATGLTELRLALNDIEDLSPLSGLASLSFLDLSNNRISDTSPLAGLTSLRHLHLSNNRILDASPLSGMTSLYELALSGNGISDLSPVSHLTSLDTLHVSNNLIPDVSPLAGMTSLRFLQLANNAIPDASPLADLTSLSELDLSGNAISDLSPMSGLTSLLQLGLSDNRITDASPLARLTLLDVLLLSDNGISDVSALSGLTSLDELHLSDNAISDLSPLAPLTSLDRLYLSNNGISDASPLARLTLLDVLNLSDNDLSDLSPLSGLDSLNSLALSNNEISDLSPLSGLKSLITLYLSDNRIASASPLSSLSRLTLLDLSENRISNIPPLSILLTVLDLSDNQISNLGPLSGKVLLIALDLSDNKVADVTPLSYIFFLTTLDLSNNPIADLSPLSNMLELNSLDLSDNGMSDPSSLSHLTGLKRLGLSNNGIADLSALADLERLVRLEAVANAIVDVGPVTGLAYLRSLDLGGNAVADVMPLASEPESLRSVSLWRNPLDADALDVHLPALRQRGVGVTGGGWRVPYFPPAGGFHQGFVRVVSSVVGVPESGEDAFDRAWVYASGHDIGPARLQLGARKVRHFNADDLVSGNRQKSLRSKIGSLTGESLDVYASANIDVLSYIRTTDGFVTSMHDTVPWLPPDDARLDALRGSALGESASAAGGHFVPIFNPASNSNQRSSLRLANASGEDIEVAVHAVDDNGVAAGPVRLTLSAQAARTLTAEELESGVASSLSGSLGDGAGKWRLVVSADAGTQLLNLMSSPTGHLTNLSTSSDGGLTVPLFPSASHPTQQGFVRVANLSTTAGTAEVRGYDDSGRSYGPLTLQLPAGRTVHFNSDDWESGGADKGLEGAAGAGEGAWRLEFESALDIVVSAYVRTSDGFLTSMHDLVDRDTCAAEEVEGGPIAARRSRPFAFRPCRDARRVPFFNPASNTRQVSSLRLVNRGGSDTAVTVFGVDDEGAERGPVSLSLPAGVARTLTSRELESGDGDGLTGALGDGTGKWELRVSVAGEAAGDVMVMSLLESPTGHLSNLSTWPDGELRLQ